MSQRRLSVGCLAPDGAVDATSATLRDAGHQVTQFDDVDRVLDAVHERSVDAVVVEHAGGIDAAAVLEAVREVDDLYPVVVYADDGDEALAARCVDLDVDGYVRAADGADGLLEALSDVRPVDDPRRDAEGMLDALLSIVPRSLSIYFKDTAGRHVAVVESFPGLIGPPYAVTPDGRVLHTAADVVGQTDFDLYPTALADETVADEARIMHTGEPVVDKLEHSVEGDGSDVFVATSKAPWYDSTGRLRGIVGVTLDVTERETQRRALERQNDRLERFASVLSHDLRNPLSVAQGRLDALEGDEAAEEDVVWALDRMEELITEVLELARQGSIVDESESVALDEPAQSAWATVDGGTLDVGDLPTVEGDPERLRALFENLFRNAVEHGGDDVAVTVESTSNGFAVLDDGPGIPAGERDRIFEHGVTTRPDGTGFGLPIVREIVEAHGWSITAGAAEGGGARFDVRFA